MKKRINRRNFLKVSATVGAGALFVPEVSASTLKAETVKATHDIPVRTLGRTGIKVPILSMGVMNADNPNVVRAAYNAGLFHFDTANGYQRGRNEEMLGEFFKDKPRESFCISTKTRLGFPVTDESEEQFMSAVETSLKRLQMDYVDIFYGHAFSSVEQVKDPKVIATLQKLKETGKAKFIGFSTHATAQNPELLDAAIEAGVYDVILISYNFRLDNLQELNPAIERAAKAGIGLVAMKTMAGGTEDAEGKKVINTEACLKWAWKNENIATAIPGFISFEQLDKNLEAVNNLTLTQDEQQYLATLCTQDSLFCQQCNACVDQCPENLQIPDLMRAYMYAYGYKFARQAQETMLEAHLTTDACAGCDACKVSCTSGFNIGAKIAAIKPIINTPAEFLS